ncbi:MAG: single-stranded-DNA-specific exonuclease RecJ, partial [Candidatus Omnitrophota bacterium]
QPNAGLQKSLSKGLDIPPILAQVLINRGVESIQEAEQFLNPKLSDLLSPWQMKDMEPAVTRLKQALKLKQKVLIFGDYDVDGITSVALLKTHLTRMGIPTMHYIPHRVKEGYGLNLTAGKIAKQSGVKLVITVDCGINSFSVIDKFRSWGIDVIVTDHHEPQDKLPKAVAIINPKRKDCAYRYKDLSGVGVAYKFAQAITNDNLWEDLDLVALGTIADSVALNGENRIIAKEGLERIFSSPRVGIQSLIDVSGMNRKRFTGTSAVSYILGPRINASGRIDTAEDALELLLCQTISEADDLAKLLNTHNRKRQTIEERIFKEAKNLIDKEVNFKEHSVIVVSGRDWHTGVLGIVASRLSDRFYRPTVLISEGDSDYCRGSARSIKNFSIFDAFLHCQKHLEDFGGHKLAAGLTIAKENIQDFRRDINQFARQMLLKEFLIPSVEVDAEIALAELSESLIQQLKNLEPFGSSNPKPLFYTRNLSLRGQPQVLSRETLKFWVTDSEFTYPVIGFGLARLRQGLVDCDSLDLVYAPEIDNWQDSQGLILEAKEVIINAGIKKR